MHRPLRSLSLFLACLAAAFAAAVPAAHAAPICGEGMYSYAGFTGFSARSGTTGVAASIEQAAPLGVRAGHVAGWVGVVDPRSGGAWLQAGLSAMPGATRSSVYYEVAVPGRAPVYHQLALPASSHRFAVREERLHPGWWTVSVDGRSVAPPVHLPGSHGRWIPQVLGESWAGQATGECNDYAYAFTGVQLLSRAGRPASGIAGPLHADADYVVLHPSRTSFVAASRGVSGARVPANGG